MCVSSSKTGGSSLSVLPGVTQSECRCLLLGPRCPSLSVCKKNRATTMNSWGTSNFPHTSCAVLPRSSNLLRFDHKLPHNVKGNALRRFRCAPLCVGRAGLAGAALQPAPFQGDREACGEAALGQGRGMWAGILSPHPGGWFVQPWFLLIISGDCIWAAPRLTRGSCCGEGTPCSVEGGK